MINTRKISTTPENARLDEAIRAFDAQLTFALSPNPHPQGEGLSLLSVRALSQLAERIRAQGFAIRPLALVRSPLDYAHSIAQQLIRGGQHLELVGCGPLLSPRPMKRLTIPDGQREISTLLSVFGEQLELVPFRRAAPIPWALLVISWTTSAACLRWSRSSSRAARSRRAMAGFESRI